MSGTDAGKLPVLASLVLGAVLALALISSSPLTELHPIFLLALPLMCLAVLGMVVSPRTVVLGLIFSRVLLDPLLNTTKSEGGFGFGAVFNLAIVVLTAYLMLSQPRPAWTRGAFFKSWVVFIAVCVAAAAFSPFPAGGMRGIFNLLSYLCMAMIPSYLGPEKNDKKFWIGALFLSTLLPVMIANLDMARGGTPSVDAGNRILGTFTHPNILGFYLVWVMMLALFVIKSGLFRLNGLQRILMTGYFLNLIVLLAATRTRNAWICAWLFFFAYGVIKERRYLIYCGALLAAGLSVSTVATRMTDIFSQNSVEVNSLAWRFQVWGDSLPAILEKPFLGHGVGSFRELSSSFLVANKEGAEAHSVYIQLLFEAGAAGLIAYAAIFWNLIRDFFRRFRRSFGGLSAEYALALSYLFIYLLIGVADNLLGYLTLNWYVWFFIGVLLKATRFQRTSGPAGAEGT